MSKKDEAIRAAVEALEKCRIVAVPSGKDVSPRFVTEALSLLRSAMEEGEEPDRGRALYEVLHARDPKGHPDPWDNLDPAWQEEYSGMARQFLYASPIAADTKDKQ